MITTGLLYSVPRIKLTEAFSRWQSYEELFSDLSKWLKDVEKKLKQETGPQTDLPSKRKHLDVVQVVTAVYGVANSYVCPGYFFW